CALPAPSITRLISPLGSEQQAFFDAITYSSSVALAVGLSDPLKSNLYGFFPAPCESEYLAAVTIESGKLSASHPTGPDVIALFSSGLPPHKLIISSAQALYDVLGRALPPTSFPTPPPPAVLTYHVRRWPFALPLFDVGHFRRLQAFAQGRIETGPIV